MRKIIAGLLALAMWTSPATAQYIPYEVDFADGSLSAPLNTSVGNTPTIRVYYKQDGTNFNPSSYESYLKWGKDDSSVDGMVTVPGVNYTNGYSDFFCASNTFGRVVKDGYWSVYLTRSNGTQNITAIRANGGLQVERSPEISSALALQRTTAINWDLLVNTGTLPWVAFAIGANTDILARINIGVLSNWVVGVSNTFDARIDALDFATGTPVYVESDPVWVGASNLYYTKVLADARFATGTPLYVESDPLAITNIQASGSGNVFTGLLVVGRSGELQRGTIAGGSGTTTAEEFTVTGDAGNADWKWLSFSGSGAGYTNDQASFWAYNLTHNGTAWNERTLTNRVGAMIGFEPYYEFSSGTGTIRQAEYYLGFVHTNVSPQGVLGDAASRLFQFNWVWPGSSGYPDGGRTATMLFDEMYVSNVDFRGLARFRDGTRFDEPLRLVNTQTANTNTMMGQIVGVFDQTPLGGVNVTNARVQFYRYTNSPQTAISFALYGDEGQTKERARIDGTGMSVSGGVSVAGTITATALIGDGNIYSTNIFPDGFVHIGGQQNRFNMLINTGSVSGAAVIGGFSNLFQVASMLGAGYVGGRSNYVNSGTHNGAGWLGGENNTWQGNCYYSGIVAGHRNYIGNINTMIGAGEDCYSSGGYSLTVGRGTTNQSSNYSFNWGYQSAVRSAAGSMAGGDRAEAKASESIALGSMVDALHRGATIIGAPGSAFASGGTRFGSSGTNTFTWARYDRLLAGKTSNDLWGVVLTKIVTNAHAPAYTPYCEGAVLIIVGTNERTATAIGPTTNDWRLGPTMTAP